MQILLSVHSEQQLMEPMDHSLMLRRFVGLGTGDPVWVPIAFSRTRDRLLKTHTSRKMMLAVVARHAAALLVSDDQASAQGGPCKARAPMKGFQPKADATLNRAGFAGG